jgi:hypothetical protein
MAYSDWNSGGRNGRPDAFVRQTGFLQAAGRPAIQWKKLASLFPNRNLYYTIYYSYVNLMAN